MLKPLRNLPVFFTSNTTVRRKWKRQVLLTGIPGIQVNTTRE